MAIFSVSIDFDDDEMSQVDESNPNDPTNPLCFLRPGDGNDDATSAFLQLFQLLTDSILCRFRRMQHIAGWSLACALCTCSPTIASRKYLQENQKKKKQSS